MKNIYSVLLLVSFIGFPKIMSQNPEVVFANIPVLLKENGTYEQQLIAKYKSDKQGKIAFYLNKKEIFSSSVVKGENNFLLTVPSVNSPRKIQINVNVDNDFEKTYTVDLLPVKRKWTIYFVQHSHTDIGYTRPQSEILAEQMRYIDYALDYCDQTDNLPDEAKFRWTCESSWVTREYLRTRPEAQKKRLFNRIKEGRIEATGMFANMSEIADENTMFDFLQPLKEIKDAGIPVFTAMQNDVNGIAWCMPDYFKNTGVKYLIMGINETRSIRPFDKPTCFWWESPSGARLMAFRGEHYMTGNFFHLEKKEVNTARFLSYLSDLEKKGYPFDRIELQFSGYFTDNAPPSTTACDFVDKWNKKYEYPKLKLATAKEFMEYVEKNHGTELPVYRKAWLDWWTDGFGSISRETAEIRKTQNTVQSDEGLFAMISMLNGELSPDLQRQLEHINENIIFFDEHTVGAAESISDPFSENTVRQWLQKGAYAWEAVKKTTLLHEEALARLTPFFKSSDAPLIYVINSQGWKRSGHVQLFIDNDILPVDGKYKIVDLSTNEMVPFQLIRKRAEGAYWLLEVSEIPALGMKGLKIEPETAGDSSSEPLTSSNEILENKFYKLTINKATGAINSLFDKELNVQLYDESNSYNIGQPVRETSEIRDKKPFIHTTAFNVKINHAKNGSLYKSIGISMDLDGFTKGTSETPKGIECEIRLYNNVKKIELKYTAHKEILTNPEALYVVFPFKLDGSKIVFETTGGILDQGDQLPGSSSDWNVAQNFVSVRGTSGQIILVSDEVPLWQFSDFNMGKFERYPKPGKPWLYSYVMNNYWMTNFRAYQEGAFSWGYQLTTTSDTTNAYATKYAWGERNFFATRTLPAGKNELKMPVLETLKMNIPENVMLINIRPSHDNKSLILHLRELNGLKTDVKLSDIKDLMDISEVNALGEYIENPGNTISMMPYAVRFFKITMKK